MNKRITAVRAALLIFLAAPVVAYVWAFGWQISRDHTRWGEFGSAMSGVYTPILTLLTLAVLVFQARIQKQVHDHELTQAFIQQARADIEFYVQRLDEAMSTPLSYGNTARELLHAQFEPSTLAELDSDRARALAKELDIAAPRILSLLYAIQAILAGLSASQEAPYRVNYTSAIQKLTSMLSFETCVALENFHRARTEGRLSVKYAYSPILTANI
jgi:hypothetical protein